MMDDPPGQTASELHLPESVQKRPMQGTVVRAGPGKYQRGELIPKDVDETGDRKRGHGIPFAPQQYIGKVAFTAR
jgi:co-chaperonin GroES (HSP10)